MNEGVGSTTILVIMMVFVTVVSAYMAFNVNYNKAFRLKNKVIATYNKYDGMCGSECDAEIAEYAKEIGYSPHRSLNCDSSDIKPAGSQTIPNNYYCGYKIDVKGANSTGGSTTYYDEEERYYYRILTRIDIQIPVVQNVFGLRILTVTGDTKVFTVED